MSNLYIVATPIGNLGDISLRALDVLKSVDLILCEDTRETKKLLSHYNINKPTLSYHQHSKLEKVDKILQMLKEGENIALVSDAGTPGISDPGNQLVSEVVSSGCAAVVPVPGPSAAAAAASVSGFPMDRFLFMGFPPIKKKRKKFFEEVVSSSHPVIFYESPHRIIKSLAELSEADNSLEIIVCRELTKKFETIYRGSVDKVVKEIIPKGEFVVVVRNK